MKGRKPTPTAMKLLHGNPGKRKLNNDPLYKGEVTAPDWLTPLAMAEWHRVMLLVADLDLVKATDQANLATYCQAYARYRQAEEQIDAEGQTVKEPIVGKDNAIKGYRIKRHPATQNSKDAVLVMMKAAANFGFDPSSRSRVQVPKQGDDKTPGAQSNDSDDLDALLGVSVN